MIVYIERQFFTLYNYAYIYNYIFIANLINILSRYHILNRELFITYYKKTIQKVIFQIIVEKYFNFTTNEIFNI